MGSSVGSSVVLCGEFNKGFNGALWGVQWGVFYFSKHPLGASLAALGLAADMQRTFLYVAADNRCPLFKSNSPSFLLHRVIISEVENMMKV